MALGRLPLCSGRFKFVSKRPGHLGTGYRHPFASAMHVPVEVLDADLVCLVGHYVYLDAMA